MKTFILAAMMLFGLQSKAGNEGPQAEPQQPPQVLVEYKQHGGLFVPPGVPSSYFFQILTDGTSQVIAFTVMPGSYKQDVIPLASLDSDDLEHLKALVKKVRPGKLYDANPSSPGCMDAPSFSWVAHKGAEEIMIGQTVSCKTMKRKNGSKADKEIIAILNALADSYEKN